MVSLGLVMNLALSYCLMLAPSRQYLEAFVLGKLSRVWPGMFGPLPGQGSLRTAAAAAVMAADRAGKTGGRSQATVDVEVEESEEEDVDGEHDAGRWTATSDGWARCWVRNLLRASLVWVTASLATAVPHFALLSGLVGACSDSLQSLVLPPLLYLCETRTARRGFLPRPITFLLKNLLRWKSVTSDQLTEIFHMVPLLFIFYVQKSVRSFSPDTPPPQQHS